MRDPLDRPVTVRDLVRALNALRSHNLAHLIFSRADGALAAVIAELERVPSATAETFVIEDQGFHRSGLRLPVKPIKSVTEIRNGKGDSLPVHRFLIDTATGFIKYSGNVEFSEYPYTVTVER